MWGKMCIFVPSKYYSMMKKIIFLVASVMMALTVGAQPAGHVASQFSPRKAMSHPGAKADCQWKMSRFYTDDYYQIFEFSYDAEQHLVAMSDSISEEYSVIDSMTYDAAGNMVRLSGWQLLSGEWKNVYYIDYTYNDAGLITSRTNYNNFGDNWELGGVYSYTYNAQNQLVLTVLDFGGMLYQKTEYQYDGEDCVEELWYSYSFDADALLPTEKYVTSYENGRKVLVLDSVSDDGTYWMYNGRYTYLYDNSGNCVEYHHYDDMDREVERSHYSYDHTMPLSSTLIPWNPEIDRPRTYDNVDACVREAWYSLDADHVLQYVCDYIYEYNDVVTAIQNAKYQKVSVYPNPASGRVMLVGLQDGAAEVQVYDLSGQLLSVRIVSGPTTEVDLSAFAPGCYLLKIMQGTTVQVVKLVMEK